MSLAPEATDVFVSYSRADKIFVDILVNDLHAQGFSTWVDRQNLWPGQVWNQELLTAIDRAKAVVVVLSPTAVASEHVRREYERALANGKVVLTVLYKMCDVPESLQHIQYQEITDSHKVFEGVRRLAAALHLHGVHPTDGVLAGEPSTPMNMVFRRQEAAYRVLERHVAVHPVQQATLLQYSGISARGLLRALLSAGATVTLFVQDPETARRLKTEEQAERITMSLRWLPGELADLYDPERLLVRQYRSPGSVNAVKIDDQILCLGWYAFEYVDEAHRRPHYGQDETEISGHDVATVMALRGTSDFIALDRTFTMLLHNLDEHAQTVALQ